MIPYEYVIRHGHLDGHPLNRCDPCRYSTINHACGHEWCNCLCMENPSAEADLAPEPIPVDFSDLTGPEQMAARSLAEKPGPPTWKIPADTPTSDELGPLMIPPREDTPPTVPSARVAGAFWIGTAMTAAIALLAASDINPWLRGILIALAALTGMASAGHLMKGK